MVKHYYLGCDYGASGAFCLMDDIGIVAKIPMPKHPVDGGIDHYEVEAFFVKVNTIVKTDELYVATEKLHAIFGSSAKSNYSFGHNNGYVKGLLHIHFGRKIHEITARKWQKWIFAKTGVEEKSKNGKRDTKAMVIEAIQKLYPDEDLTRTKRSTKPHDGICDAIGIAEYLRYLERQGELNG